MSWRIARCWLLVLALGLPAPGLAEALFTGELTARYRITLLGAEIARGRWSLAPAGEGRHRLRGVVDTTGIAGLLRSETISELSEWEYAGGRPRPLRYAYRREGTANREQEVIHFDWAAGAATVVHGPHRRRVPVSPDTLDGLVYLLALIMDLQAGKEELVYDVIANRKRKTYRLERVGRQEQSTALGTFDTLKVARVREHSPRQTTFWFAPALRFLPVRVEHREKEGHSFVITIAEVEGLAVPSAPEQPGERPEAVPPAGP